ncbi:hypothetical protein IFM89_007232 [Coptis chinensis]|uniref:Uncharacterized protein n=1 Tax=Coptis chinensis TaxID=261450 RepID=A0A835ILN6_9MAGN|nr:hypothetical protein IFM89_007232 [Coptis chinensis]
MHPPRYRWINICAYNATSTAGGYATSLASSSPVIGYAKGYQFDGGKSKKQTKIIAPQSNDHAHLELLVKELDGLCGAALGFIVSEAITNTWYCNDSRLFGKSY